jgi:hypothetical protein
MNQYVLEGVRYVRTGVSYSIENKVLSKIPASRWQGKDVFKVMMKMMRESFAEFRVYRENANGLKTNRVRKYGPVDISRW